MVKDKNWNFGALNWRALWAVAVKDMKAIGSVLQVWLPLLILPLIFTVIMPGALILGVRYSGVQIYFGVNYFFAPFFLIIPLMAAGVISANSFAGEKEQQTMESLLFAPLNIVSIFLGKLLATFINVLISAKAKGFQEAYQLSGLVILPVLGLLFSQMAGILFLDSVVLFWIGVILFVIDAFLIGMIGRYLKRDQLFESLVG